ncbi:MULTISPECIES: nucleotide-binding protein [unclassified Aureimonas]|uniref:nucleotide-binding protein n=1 Tax=unclassified Aureimonas TaxID=2615206 RepID=UPI000ABCA52E|nr:MULTISPECIES: nucleotide-binding protein [unclassified Aureimonas]
MKPKVFIGSSREGLHIANAVHSNLTREAECSVWNQGIFLLSQSALSALIAVLRESDFGIFVFSPDDLTVKRDEIHESVRDNVILEMGLFIGRLGIERSFFLIPDNAKDLRLPTDLMGITAGQYEGDRQDRNWHSALGPACGQIARQMAILKSFQDSRGEDTVPPAPQPKVESKPSSTVADSRKTIIKKSSRHQVYNEPSAELDGNGIKASKYKNAYLLEGETKPCKEMIKELGGRWIGALNGWTVSPAALASLVERLPKIEINESELNREQ